MSTSLTLLFSLLPLSAAAQSGSPTAEAILDELEATIGDAAARARATNIVMTGKIAVEGVSSDPDPWVQDMAMEGTFEKVHLGAKAKWTFTWPGLPSMTQGSTGTYCWSTEFGITIKEGDEQDCVLRQFGIERHAPWRSLYARAKLVGERELDGRPCYELEMLPRTGKADRWFVDREASTLVGFEFELPNPNGGMIPVEARSSDFKRVDGVLYAHSGKVKFGAMVLLVTLTEIEHPQELAPERVAPPAEVIAAHADPKLRAQNPFPDDLTACNVTALEAQPCATIRVKIRTSEVSKTLAVILPEVIAYLVEAGVDMAGPPFARYHEMSGDTFVLEAGMPTKTRVEGRGRVQSSELPAGKTAIAWHVGSYHELPRTYSRLEAWMKSQSLASRGAFWEIYWTDPGIEPDPAHWKTQVLWPVE